MSRELRQCLLSWFDDLWNHRRESTIDAYFCSEGTVEIMDPSELLDREGFRQHWRALTSGFPDLQLEVLSIVNDHEKGALHWRATGTHSGLWRGVPATRRPVRFSGMSILHFRGAHVVRLLDFWDRRSIAEQLHSAWLELRACDLRLTARQRDVAMLMANRLTHREIAGRLGIRPNTARRHCEAVMLKFGVHHRGEISEVLGDSFA